MTLEPTLPRQPDRFLRYGDRICLWWGQQRKFTVGSRTARGKLILENEQSGNTATVWWRTEGDLPERYCILSRAGA